MALWNITHASQCRAQLEELIDFCKGAQLELTQAAAEGLEDRIKGLLSRATPATESQMSPVERDYFYPALRDADSSAPELKHAMKWAEAVNKIQSALESHLPLEEDAAKHKTV